MRPGMPLLFGQIGRAQMFGLPGNPVSALATFLTLGGSLLRGHAGRRVTGLAACARAWPCRSARSMIAREFLRARLECGDDGLLVAPHPATGLGTACAARPRATA